MPASLWPPYVADFVAHGPSNAGLDYLPKQKTAATPHDLGANAAAELQLLVLEVWGHRLAVDILEVAEVAKSPALTRVPRTPSWHLGIAAIRSQLMPIVSLGAVLHLAPTAGDANGPPAKTARPGPAAHGAPPARVVVVKHPQPIGLAVSNVMSVARLARSALLPAGEETAGQLTWAAGFAPLGRGLTAVLSVATLERSLRVIERLGHGQAPMPGLH